MPSCLPNATWKFDLETCTYTLRAVDPIRTGQQVTIGYVARYYKHATRQEELLRRYKFQCKCTVCVRPPFERERSDLRRALLYSRSRDVIIKRDDAAFEEWLARGAPNRPLMKLVSPSQVMKSLQGDEVDGFNKAKIAWSVMEEERWFPEQVWEAVVVRLVRGFAVLEDEAAVRKYALAAVVLKKTFAGTDGGWAAVARNPRQTDWWGKLGKNRVR